MKIDYPDAHIKNILEKTQQLQLSEQAQIKKEIAIKL